MPKSTKKKWEHIRLDTCLNPYHLSSHGNRRGNLRKVTEQQLRGWDLPVTEEALQQKVCNSCRMRLTVQKRDGTMSCENQNQDVLPPQEDPPAVPSTSDESTDENPLNSDSSEYPGENETFSQIISEVNRGLSFIATSPIKQNKINTKKYRTEKIRKISDAIKNKIFECNTSLVHSDEDDDNDDDGQHVLNALQKRFSNAIDRTVKIQILTVVHQWSYRKIFKHFPSATYHMIKIAKQIAIQKDILSGPNPKSHPGLDENVINLVTAFYNSDEHSRVMPGKKDFVSLKIDGKRNHVQKRLILNNLRELHRAFKDTYPDVKCSFSKFASLRPKYCILAGVSGTHSVCVCAIHQNVKLLIDGANIKFLTANAEQVISDYHDCFQKMICDSPST